MSSEDDSEDNEIEAGCEQSEGCWESVETQLVETGVERSGHEREDSLIAKLYQKKSSLPPPWIPKMSKKDLTSCLDAKY